MHQPFDRILKNTGEFDPRGLLHLLGALPIDSPAIVTEVKPEMGLPVRVADHLFKLTWPDGSETLSHIEFQLPVFGKEPYRMTEYAMYGALQHQLPVFGTLVLPVERYARRPVEETLMLDWGGLRVEYRFRVVRLWEMDPAAIFALDRPNLLPLVTLARATPGDLARAARAVSATGNRELAATFTTLSGLRYDRNEIEELLRSMRIEDIIKPDWLRYSSTVAPLLDEVAAEGMAKGRAEGELQGQARGEVEGRAQGIRHSITQLLKRRFPLLSIPPELAACRNPELLEILFDQVESASTGAEAERAVRTTLDIQSH